MCFSELESAGADALLDLALAVADGDHAAIGDRREVTVLFVVCALVA